MFNQIKAYEEKLFFDGIDADAHRFSHNIRSAEL